MRCLRGQLAEVIGSPQQTIKIIGRLRQPPDNRKTISRISILINHIIHLILTIRLILIIQGTLFRLSFCRLQTTNPAEPHHTYRTKDTIYTINTNNNNPAAPNLKATTPSATTQQRPHTVGPGDPTLRPRQAFPGNTRCNRTRPRSTTKHESPHDTRGAANTEKSPAPRPHIRHPTPGI